MEQARRQLNAAVFLVACEPSFGFAQDRPRGIAAAARSPGCAEALQARSRKSNHAVWPNALPRRSGPSIPSILLLFDLPELCRYSHKLFGVGVFAIIMGDTWVNL
jgi:hypothetical protein